jgi:hypothetical protein
MALSLKAFVPTENMDAASWIIWHAETSKVSWCFLDLEMFKGGLWVAIVATITKQNHYTISIMDLEQFKNLEGHERLAAKEKVEIIIWRAKPLIFCAKHRLYLDSLKGCMAKNCPWLISEKLIKIYV